MNKRQREKRAKQDRRKEKYRALVKAIRDIGKAACGVSKAITKAFCDQMDKARIRREAKEAKEAMEMELATRDTLNNIPRPSTMPIGPKESLHPMFTDPPQGPTVPEESTP